MIQKDLDARERIIRAAIEILDEASDIDEITVRQIAERADVGIGTINYHFNSRDNLLSLVVGEIMANRVKEFLKTQQVSHTHPIENLKTMLKDVCRIAVANEKAVRFMLTKIITDGDMKTPLYIIPFLKDIFGKEKEEIELRVVSLQLLQPLQLAGISPDAFFMYSGIDFFNERDRNRFIDMLVDNVIKKSSGVMSSSEK